MSKKLKYYFIGVSIISIITCVNIIPLRNSHGDNTVELKSSIPSETMVDNRRLIGGKQDQIEYFNINNEQVDDVNDETDEDEIKSFSVGSYSIPTTLDTQSKNVDINYMSTTTRVNLRLEASTKSDIITTLDKRVIIAVLQNTSSEWTKVKYEDKEGYIYSKYLTDKNLSTSDNNRWGVELTDEEINLLAKILWIEARGESDLGMSAVCEVILNRIVASQFPDSLKEVLNQKNQFSSWRLRDKAQITKRELKIIHDVLRGNSDILSMDVMYFSTKPRNEHVEIKIGNHFFCREGGN